jgi:two-component system phosphate regulon response regulator OmpR
LLLRISAVLRRAAAAPTAPEPPRTLTLGDAFYDIGRGALSRGPDAIRLTATENALLQALARAPNTPLSRAELVAALGGAEGSASERAIDVQMTRLRRKIEADPRQPRYLQTVRGEGYMLTPD